MPGRKKTPDETARGKQKVIGFLRQGHTLLQSAVLAQISQSMLKNWRHRDPEFLAASNEAYDEGTEQFSAEVKRRAIEGWNEPVYYQGQQVGHVRKFSDALLMFELKKRNPAYRDKVDMQHSGGIDITKLVAALDKVKDE
jgi:hypothetical protein